MRATAHKLCLRSAWALWALWGAAGCGSVTVPAECHRTEAIALHIHPATHLNPDRGGLPRSVVLRLYQLDDARSFRSSSFERVWAGGLAADGGKAGEQLLALPGRSQAHSLRREPNAQYLAVAANFRERSPSSEWRGLVRLPPPRNPCELGRGQHPSKIEITLTDYALRVR